MLKQTKSAATKNRFQNSGRRDGFKFSRFLLTSLGALFIILVVVTLGLLFWLVIRPLPQTNGTISIPGLSSSVTITRDKAGVPHIVAANTSDLFMAQGYVTAQDRLWQLEFNRRVGSGRLSEVLGSAALNEDKFLRTIGLRRAASQELANIAPDDRLIMESYAKGVNAFIDTHKDNLPLEFSLLGFTPEPYTILDMITWGKVMAFDLGGNYSNEILRAALVQKIGPDKASLLMPTSQINGTPFIIPASVSYQGIENNLALIDLQARVHAIAGDVAGTGSNNWVIAGAKSTTGKPILANDPHLGIRNPSVWYEIQLTAPGWNVAGVTFPGVPSIVIGHNNRIAWGVTNVTGDSQDFYIEKLNPADSNQYEFKGQFENIQTIPEEIKIKGQASEKINVRLTRHGPIMNDVIDQLHQSQPMALQWVALRNTPLISAVLQYGRAQNWQEFRTALKNFNIAGQNFVFADIDGNIGYQLTGLWPVRAKGDGLLPVPGWTGEYEWTGYVPFENLPSVYNPPGNFIATANNQTSSTVSNVSGNAYIGQEFDAGWRAERITQLLTNDKKTQLSMQDIAAIQSDIFTIPGYKIAGFLGKLPSDSKTSPAIEKLKSWDGNLTTDSVAGAVYKVTFQYILENMLKTKLGDNLFNEYLGGGFGLKFVFNLLDEPENEWWGEGGRDALLQKSVGQAVDDLTSRFGSNINDWKWGKLHTVSFQETPIGGAVPGPIGAVINLKTIEQAGDSTTVAAASYSLQKPYTQTSGVSFRQIVNLANFDSSLIVNTIGESGQPFSKHYGDNIDDWKAGRYHSFLFTTDAVNNQKEDILTLQPK